MSDSEKTTEDQAAVANDEIITMNKVVSFHYRLSEVDADGNPGEWMEDSHGAEPLYYIHGFHNVVVGLEKALEGKTTGQNIEITLKPEDAYGPRRPDSMKRVPLKYLQKARGVKKLKAGSISAIKTDKGVNQVVVMKVGKFNADVDFNHPLAGRTLYYEIEVVAVRDASEEEISHGHVHGAGGHQH